MARLFTSGFELNSITDGVEFTTNNATVEITTTNPRSGTYHGRVSGTSNGFWRQVLFTSNQATVGYIGVAIYIQSPVNANTQLVRFSNASNVSQCNITLTPSNTLVLLQAGGGQVGQTSQVLQTGRWYYVELKNNASGAGAIEARLDGKIFASGANSAAGTWARALVGIITGSQTTADVYFDDFKVNDSSGSNETDYPGTGFVIIARPNANGSTIEWTPSSGANYECVDEVTPNDATNYISATAVNTEDSYALDAVSVSPTIIVNCIQVGCRFANNIADATSAFRLQIARREGDTILQSANIVPNSTSYATYSSSGDTYLLTSYIDPNSAKWTPATLNSMRIGAIVTVNGGTGGIRISTLWAYIDYTTGDGKAFVWALQA